MSYDLTAFGIHPRTVLDIGACLGDFSASALRAWPGCRVCMVEANPERWERLKPHGEYHIAVLGRETGRLVDWYRSSSGYITGDSMYRENTWVYDDEHVIVERRVTIRLDDLLPGRRFDFAKIDVQGAELDVLMGGVETLSECQHILMEVTHVDYNRDAPSPCEAVGLLESRGFRVLGEGNQSYLGKVMIATDVLFGR